MPKERTLKVASAVFGEEWAERQAKLKGPALAEAIKAAFRGHRPVGGRGGRQRATEWTLPARAGRPAVPGSPDAAPRVHPRACGEQRRCSMADSRRQGSSPPPGWTLLWCWPRPTSMVHPRPRGSAVGFVGPRRSTRGLPLSSPPGVIAGPRSMKPGCSDATTTGHRRTPIQPAGAFRTHEFLCSVAAEWRSHRVVAVVAEYQYLAARSRAHAIQSRLAHASRQCDVAAADHRPAGIRRDRGAFN